VGITPIDRRHDRPTHRFTHRLNQASGSGRAPFHVACRFVADVDRCVHVYEVMEFVLSVGWLPRVVVVVDCASFGVSIDRYLFARVWGVFE
jgi:hypothetical protein